NHLAQRTLSRFGQVFVNSHGDEVRRRFSARPFQMHVFADNQLKGSDKRSLQRGDIYFSVSLSGVSVAGQEQCSAGMNRNEQRCACDQFLVVEISRVNPGWSATNSAGDLRRGDAQTPEERL